MRDTTLGLLLVAVVFTVVIIAAARRRVLLRMSLRNIARRKTRAAIVVLGLMVGTALISSAMVVGDTLEYIFTEDVLQRWGQVDEVIGTQSAGVYLNFTDSYYTVLSQDLASGNAPIDGIAPGIVQRLTTRNEREGLWAEPVSVIGIDSALEAGFGSLITTDAKSVATQDLGQGQVYANQRVAEKLSATTGSQLRVYFSQASFVVTVADVLRDEGTANLDKQQILLMRLDEAQTRFQMPGSINFIRVSNTGNEEDGVQHTAEVTAAISSIMDTHGWNPVTRPHVAEVKQGGLDDARGFSKDVTQVFFIMGAFAVVAGILLIINIFVMMAEERKSEMGISRAVGMTRGQLTQSFLFEGAIFSALSALLGSLVGLGLGSLVVYFFSVVFPISERALTVTFHFEISSLILAFAVGILITFFTVVFASWFVSRLNIVRAIRGQSEPVPRRTTPVEASVALFLVLGGVAAIWLRSYPPANIVSIPLLILGGMIGSLRIVNPRYTATLGGIGIIAWVLGPKFVESNEPDIYVPFVTAGLLLVLGAVLIVVFNSSPFLRMITRFAAKGKAHPVLKTSLTYPMSKKFQTGMTLGMFSLIMFAICIISMIQGMQGSAISNQIPQQTGGYDLVAHTTEFNRIDDVTWSRGMRESGVSEYIESVSNATVVPVGVLPPGRTTTIPYTLWGVDNVLLTTNEFGFRELAEHYFDRAGQYHSIQTPRDAWTALANSDELALVDGNAAGGTEVSPAAGELRLEVGDRVGVVSYQTGATQNFTILGILQQSLPGTMGLFVNQQVVRGNYSMAWSAYFFQLRPGVSARYVADSLKSAFIVYGYGLETVIVAEVLGQVIETADRVLLLMQAYLGIGLIVGIAGVAVIMVRAVVERRQQIGVLRAIGYTKRMVMVSFLLEISFIALFGSVIGIACGIVLAYKVWSMFFQEVTPFIIPWLHLATVALIAAVATVLATASPAVRASKTPPAAALRYSE